MYLGDPRENQIDLDNHTVWEEDKRYEDRWVWHGKVLDLCNLSPEEYAQTIFIVKEADTGLIANPLYVYIDGKNLVIKFAYAPASSIAMIIRDSDKNEDFFTIPQGAASPFTATLTNVDSSKVLTILIGSSYGTAVSTTYSDSVYKYTVHKEIVVSDKVQYAYMKHIEVEAGLDESKLKPILKEATVINNESYFEYALPPVDKYGINDLSQSERDAILDEEQIDLLICTTTNLEKVYLNETDDQTTSWIFWGNLTISGISYQIFRFVEYHFTNVHDSKYEPLPFSDAIFKYKIKVS